MFVCAGERWGVITSNVPPEGLVAGIRASWAEIGESILQACSSRRWLLSRVIMLASIATTESGAPATGYKSATSPSLCNHPQRMFSAEVVVVESLEASLHCRMYII